jgi:hypothetical protein
LFKEVTLAQLEASMAKIKIHLDGLEYTLIEASPLYTIDAIISFDFL